jgi:AcrR family transcriptional regulator
MALAGRRPGPSDTREAILTAARESFAELGYDATTIRGVAARAEVDPALVHHYFGPKVDLFATAMELPASPSGLIAPVLEGPRDQVGERLIRTFLSVWDREAGRAPMLGLVRSAAANEQAARMLREFVERELVGRLLRQLGSDRVDLRAALVASQMVGLVMIRYVLRIGDLAAADPETVAAVNA